MTIRSPRINATPWPEEPPLARTRDSSLAAARRGEEDIPGAAILNRLEKHLQSLVPGSLLVATLLPQAPEVALYLLNEDYPRGSLDRDQAEKVMASPPYWSFCWPGGRVLGRYFLDHPESVAGKTLVDLGAGSGVAGIAAKKAGAKRVIFCDLDEMARAAGKLNADLNKVDLEFVADFESLLTQDVRSWAVAAADVFYDRSNLPLLNLMTHNFASAWVADSRTGGESLPGMDIIGEFESHPVPDLDESMEFRRVTLYRSRMRRP